jgi:ABC-type spermidine/putrescine transport system permease subunit II
MPTPRLPGFALALPAWLWFGCFFAAPVGWIVYYSFGYKPDYLTPIATNKLSLSQYGSVLSGSFLQTFEYTLEIAAIGTVLCLAIAFPFAYAAAILISPRRRVLVLALVIIPYYTNFLVRTIGWRILLSPEGWLSHLLQTIGVRTSPLDILDTRTAVQLGVVYNYLPLMILPLIVTLSRLDPAMREASRDLGAGAWKTLWQVTIPQAMPGIVAGTLLVFIPLSGDYITASVLGGVKGNMVGLVVANEFLLSQDWSKGAAMAVALVGMTLLVVAIGGILALLTRRVRRHRRAFLLDDISTCGEEEGSDFSEIEKTATSSGLASWKYVHRTQEWLQSKSTESWVRIAPDRLAVVWLVAVIVFLFLPIVMVVIYSFDRGRALITWSGFGINWYQSLPGNSDIVSAVETSLKAAVVAALLSTVLGTLAGIALARRPGKWVVPFTACIFLLLVTPEIVNAMSLLIWYVRIQGPFGPSNHIFSYGILRLSVGHSLFSLAVVTLIVRARLAGVGEELEQAAADLYAGPVRRFLQITLPIAMPAVIAGALLSFTLSMDDTIISAFVSVAGATPWPVYVFSATHAILRPDVAAMATIMFVVTLVTIGLAGLIFRRTGGDAVVRAQVPDETIVTR